MPVTNKIFYTSDEIESIKLTRDPTRRWMEKRGLFPARIHIAPRRIAWWCAVIQAWLMDPENWAAPSAADVGT
jgi:hypothetical protein